MTTSNSWANAEREADRRHGFDLSAEGQRQHFVKKAQANKPVLKPVHMPVLNRSLAVAKPVNKAVPPPAFNFYLHTASQKVAVLVDRVIAQWMKTGHLFRRPISPEVLQGYKSIVECVTLNVLSVLLKKIESVRIRRERALYTKRSRYRPDLYDKKVLTVLDDLHNMKVLRQVKGERFVSHFDFSNEKATVNHNRAYNQTELFVGQVVKELAKLLNVESILEIGGFCPAFTDTWLRLIMGQEGCHGTKAEVFSGVQA